MKTFYQSLLFALGALALAGTAYAQQPPDVVQSDSYYNTAMGTYALISLSAGFRGYGNINTAVGQNSLFSTSTGSGNTAVGFASMYNNTTGGNNAAVGAVALDANTTGMSNTAVGFEALQGTTTGSNNIGVGYHAGYALVKADSNNIDIGNVGNYLDNNTIRIGNSTHTATVIAGIHNSHFTGATVVVSSTGRLGILSSSRRYKRDIHPMNTEKLKLLRPVSFHLKDDPKGAVQYGFIAEEVAKVYPELVIRDEKGRIDGVRYDELAPMLLNEVQEQASEIRELKDQQKQFATQAEVRELKQQLQAALLKLQTQGELVAQR